MKRRDALRSLTFGMAGFAAARTASAQPMSMHGMSPHSSMMPMLRSMDGPQDPMIYVRRVVEMLRWVRANQMENIMEGANQIALAVEENRNIWSCWDLGHTNESDLFPGRNGKPEFLIPGYDFDRVQTNDLVLANFPWPAGYINDLAERDLFVIGGPCPWGGDLEKIELIKDDIAKLKIRPFADLWIDTPTDAVGAQVPIPGSPTPLGPESGPLNMTILWMMVADACRILARRGISAEIVGDEEPLTGDRVPYIELGNPVMDTYFDEVLRQLDLIGAEIGYIRDMASMAVDTLLAGKNVYFYSRYYPSLAGEAVGRRGGFLFAKGAADGRIEGQAGDMVVMGTYEPDDEADLKNLDEFKSRGMKITSIGPMTRNLQHPEGPAVYKESQIHIGRMMDTYGLFAVPGFERKVCPTSGIMATSILWVMNAQLAFEMVRRTGTTPAIYMNGALKESDFHNSRMSAIVRERGY